VFIKNRVEKWSPYFHIHVLSHSVFDDARPMSLIISTWLTSLVAVCPLLSVATVICDNFLQHCFVSRISIKSSTSLHGYA